MTVYDNVAKNLQKILTDKNASALSISKAIGVSPSIISRFLNREINSINLDVLIKIANYLSTDLLDLMGKDEESKQRNKTPEKKESDEYDYISFYDVKVSAGTGQVVENETSRILPVEKTFIQRLGYPTRMLAAVEVAGDSMEPTLKNGDYVIIYRPDYPADFAAGIYVLRDFSGIKVKRLDMDKLGNLEVVSDNKCYKPQIYSQEEINNGAVTIIGRVVGKLGML